MLKRLKPWRVVFVTSLVDVEPREIARRWTERGAWRFADRLLTPHGGWYEVRLASDERSTQQALDDELQRMLQEQVPSWPDHPQCEHDPIVRRGDD